MDKLRDEMKKENFAIISIVIAYFIWGIQSLYWRSFDDVSLSFIMAHRIIWAAIMTLGIIVFTDRKSEMIRIIKDKRQLRLSIISALAIGFNWFLNIYAAATKQIVEASLGQYITPIVIIFIGVLVFKEKLDNRKIIAVLLIMIGVLIYAVQLGKIPMIALLLIFSFVLYTYIKKINPVDSIVGIGIEAMLLSPIVLIFLIYQNFNGVPLFYETDLKTVFMLISTGFFTIIPLFLFAHGVKNINFTNLGFLQYIAPSISLIIGVFVLKESFHWTHFITFFFIWMSIVVMWIKPLFKKNGVIENENYQRKIQ
jgi:chloramphenicol-sensitive protein RarD